jgi:hypothetical protein
MTYEVIDLVVNALGDNDCADDSTCVVAGTCRGCTNTCEPGPTVLPEPCGNVTDDCGACTATCDPNSCIETNQAMPGSPAGAISNELLALRESLRQRLGA